MSDLYHAMIVCRHTKAKSSALQKLPAVPAASFAYVLAENNARLALHRRMPMDKTKVAGES